MDLWVVYNPRTKEVCYTGKHKDCMYVLENSPSHCRILSVKELNDIKNGETK